MRLINRTGTISAGDTEQDISYGIEFNPFMASLLSDKLYTDKPTACWRELYANAHDESDDIKVQLPSYNEPTCVIWDNGPGLDEGELISLFCTYGASNKRDTNLKLGGFGVGSKVLFSYTDTFSAFSVKDGIKTSIVCYKDAEGMPTARIVGCQDSDEQSGTHIQWGVSSFDSSAFCSSALEVFSRFENKPTFLCATDPGYPADLYSMKTDEWAVRTPEFNKVLNKTGSGVNIVMGGIAYPVNESLLDYSKYGRICSASIDIFAPIGAVQLAASREALSYDEKTIAYVSRRLDDMKDQALQMVEDEVARAPNWYDKQLVRDQVSVSLPFNRETRYGRDNEASELSKTHTVKQWSSRRGRGSGNVPARIKLDSDTNFVIDPANWERAKDYMNSDFSVLPPGYSRYSYDCVIRFPAGTSTPAGFSTRVAEFARQKGLTSVMVIPDEVYAWCLDNYVPTDHIILWGQEMHSDYKVPNPVAPPDFQSNRKQYGGITLYRVETSDGPESLRLSFTRTLGSLSDDKTKWFLLANSGIYRAADNPAVDGREAELGYLSAQGLIDIYLIPKSYASVLRGNFLNINKHKGEFDKYLKDKLGECNMLDGYVRSQLRTEFRALITSESIAEHHVRAGIGHLLSEGTWDVPSWFNRFIRVLTERDKIHIAAKRLNVNKVRADAMIKKELDITLRRLYKKPLIFAVLASVGCARSSATEGLASKVSTYLK